MFGRRSPRRFCCAAAESVLESLEPRRLLSAGPLRLHDDLKILHHAVGSSVQGITPQQIKAAYGFDSISLPGGLTADGSGQTIAVVDAFNDPNIAADLNVFDTQFGLAAPPNLRIVNGNGGTKLPAVDTGWAGEISLDVEWAHAIAPQANILLVEANSDTLPDLLTAVDTARRTPNVSVISTSWGGSEFFSFRSTSESPSELSDDFHFTTPAGHQPITFVSSAGDSGSFSGVQWPAASPNVLSVGGTSLTLNSDSSIASESSWGGTSGGLSQFEPTPAYQVAASNTGARGVPDVSYNADPNTGFAVYDSIPDQGFSGWQEVGGTSAGAPQWAALIAIADQGRARSGLGTLDGVKQTLPVLYSLYHSPASGNYATYTSFFNDVVDARPANAFGINPGLVGSGGAAVIGYDTSTGLGTPKADKIISVLDGQMSVPTGGGGEVFTLPPSPLVATSVTLGQSRAVASQSGSATVHLLNRSHSRLSGPVSISLYATSDGSISSTDQPFASIPYTRFMLAGGAAKTLKLRFTYPGGLDPASYTIVASVDALNTGTAPSNKAAPAVRIDPAAIDLSAAFVRRSATFRAGRLGSAILRITNLGDVPASGLESVSLYASTTPNLDASADPLLTTLSRPLHVKPGKSLFIALHFRNPTRAGAYFLIAATSSTASPSDGDLADKTALLSAVVA